MTMPGPASGAFNSVLPPHAPPARPTVLFVCVENSNRSQMAEAFARIYGQGHVDAHSAGSCPSGRVNPRAVEFMAELGYDLSTHQSKSLEDFNGREIDVAVTMGCGDECPLVRAKSRCEWQIPDPRDMAPDGYRAVRDLIAAKVRDLLNSLPRVPATHNTNPGEMLVSVPGPQQA